MRKMFSQNQIIDLIQKAINSGEVIIPQELPATTEATAGQILALDEDKEPVWKDEVEVKSIYCHPISIVLTSTKVIRLTCLIFNNDDTPFTLTTFKDYIDTLYTALPDGGRLRIMLSGAYNDGTSIGIASWLGKASDGYNVNAIKVNDGSSVVFKDADWTNLFPSGTQLTDGVNKIN